MKAPSDRLLLALAAVSFAACLLMPISNPDMFWHLSAARRILELRAVPTTDWLSATRSGSPWIDFEWLAQLAYGAWRRAGGMAGLWFFKMGLLSAASWILWKTLSLYETPPAYRACALALWSAASLTRSDLRPELFSMVGFAGVLWTLEARRLGNPSAPAWRAIPAFCLWANLHAGFAFGLVLLGCYASWLYLACAWAGTLIQPSGFGAYRVLWRHWLDLKVMGSAIAEWRGLSLDNPWHWPAWALLGTGVSVAAVYLWRAPDRRRIEAGPLAALAVCGVVAYRHSRLAAYYATLAVPLAAYWGMEAGLLPRAPGPRSRWSAAALCLACAAYTIGWGRHFGLFTRVFDDRFVPVLGERYLEQEGGALAERPLYNPWAWGGYLGWRLYPRFKIFQDGRYIFHPLLAEASRAVADPKSWQEFLDRYRIDVALLENFPLRLDAVRRYPDGRTKPFKRPFYVFYMPRDRWALVHWDDRALVFVRRSAVPETWTRTREYRYARPFDDEALREALRLGEVPAAAADAEFKRHDAEVAALAEIAPEL